MLLQGWTMICPELKNCQPGSRKILLVTKIFVTDDQEIEASCFGFAEQISIFELAPTHFCSSVHLMPRQRATYLHGSANVQQYLHRAISAAIRSQP